MPLALTWPDLAWRLATATLAGALIGLNRGESGNAAGLRTTLLVCLAACLAMLQVNVLMLQHGKTTDSFVVLDLMRLPLGILSGVGFIGAGSILHRDGLARGVTTAATMWYVTVIGLCAGGGQFTLAIAGTVLGLVVLQALTRLERWLPRGHRAQLTIVHDASSDRFAYLNNFLPPRRCKIARLGVQRDATHPAGSPMPGNRVGERFEIRWRARPDDDVVEQALSRVVVDTEDAASWSIER